MKIIEPSTQIIEGELAQLSIYQRIAYCAGVCYQREPNKTEEEAQAFCKKMVQIGHLSTLEMAVVHLVVEDPSYDDSEHWSPRYIQVSPNFVKDNLFVSGSLRAFKEALDGNPEWYGDALESIARSLNTTYPAIFSNDSVHTNLAGSKARSAKPNEIPWQHQHVAVRFIVNRAVSHELVRHRPMSFLQECLSGDSVVKAYTGGKQWSMKELHRLFNTASCGLARNKIRIRTMSADGEILPSKILNVVESGHKEVFRVKTLNGRSVKASANHIFFTEHGQRRLKELRIGDKLYMNGATITREWLRKEYLVNNRQRVDIASEVGMSDAWLGKQISKWGLQKHKAMYPNRKPGYGKPGMHSPEGCANISIRMKGESNPSWKGEKITERGARSRLHRQDTPIGKVCICGKPASAMHHIDRDPKNNARENIEYVCTTCHKARHYDTVMIAWLDEVVSIEACGIELTYDLEVDRPEHNFSVNGFIVHNSQRYCRYEDEVVFIKPEWCAIDWPSDRRAEVFYYTSEVAETQYKVLLANGLKPQQARAVLPNSTKTELIAYASLPQWKHIFNLRCSSAADPEMRRVMLPLKEEFKARYPEMWEEE